MWPTYCQTLPLCVLQPGAVLGNFSCDKKGVEFRNANFIVLLASARYHIEGPLTPSVSRPTSAVADSKSAVKE
jgi:hypothetical protein